MGRPKGSKNRSKDEIAAEKTAEKTGRTKLVCLKCREPFVSWDKTRNRLCYDCNEENNRIYVPVIFRPAEDR